MLDGKKKHHKNRIVTYHGENHHAKKKTAPYVEKKFLQVRGWIPMWTKIMKNEVSKRSFLNLTWCSLSNDSKWRGRSERVWNIFLSKDLLKKMRQNASFQTKQWMYALSRQLCKPTSIWIHLWGVWGEWGRGQNRNELQRILACHSMPSWHAISSGKNQRKQRYQWK